MRVLRAIHILIFIILISAPVSGLIFSNDKARKEDERFERRKLSPIPPPPTSYSDIKKFPHLFESYFDDHFGFRLSLIRLHAAVKYYLFNESSRDNILIGKDGWFFQGRGKQRVEGKGEHEFDFIAARKREKLKEKTLKDWKKILKERKDYFEAQGSKYLFLIAPKKALIYPEKLPEFLSKKREKRGENRVEQIVRYIEKHSDVPTVNLISHLKRIKTRYPHPLYLKTDGHWNPIGAFYAYRGIMNVIMRLFPEKNITPLSLDDFTIQWRDKWYHKGFTAQFGVKITESYPSLKPKKGNPLRKLFGLNDYLLPFDSLSKIQKEKKGYYSLATHEGKKFLYAHNPDKPEFTYILLMGDSFLMKFFHFFRAHGIHLIRIRSELDLNSEKLPPSILGVGPPDIVIQEVAQRYVGSKLPKNILK